MALFIGSLAKFHPWLNLAATNMARSAQLGTSCRPRIGSRPRCRAQRATRVAARSLPGVFRIRNCESNRYLRATSRGELTHDEGQARKEHLFVFVPGLGPRTGLTRLLHLATDMSIFLTGEGYLGSFNGDFPDHYWRLVEQGDDRFILQGHSSDLKLFSSSDGRLGCFPGKTYGDQLFCCEDEQGHVLKLSAIDGCYGLQDTGFSWQGFPIGPHIYTDALHAGHYVRDERSGQLALLQEERSIHGIPQGAFGFPSWGVAEDLHVAAMDKPHSWAIAHIPFLQKLEDAGLINDRHPMNTVYPSSYPAASSGFKGNGLPPSGAIRFALRPVSAGRPATFERGWLRAWHGTGLHHIEGIAREGLRAKVPFACNESKIFLSPSFLYPFCLYSTLDLMVENARFRMVVEVRVRPGSFWEHGDPYQFCHLPCIESFIPEENMEWELGSNEEDVQVVGLVLKQLRPDHPTLRHDSIQRHGCKALLYL